MYSLKLELKLNNREGSKLAGLAGFAGRTCNLGLSMPISPWSFERIPAGSDNKEPAPQAEAGSKLQNQLAK